jgi:two-component system, OmpR family, response regulator VicR
MTAPVRPLRILVVDDDPAMVGAITALVGTEGHQVITAYDGLTAVKRFREERPDLVLLDLAMPGPDGFSVAGRMRAEGPMPIVVVSGESAEEAKVRALGIGADDYLVKPFAMRELVARVRAAARRGVRVQEQTRGAVIEIAELRIDPLDVQAYVAGESANLTATEFRLLYALAREEGRVVSREELMQKIWGRRQRHRDRTVDVFVRKLRDKIDRRAPAHTFIHTRHGVGYKLQAAPKGSTGTNGSAPPAHT